MTSNRPAILRPRRTTSRRGLFVTTDVLVSAVLILLVFFSLQLIIDVRANAAGVPGAGECAAAALAFPASSAGSALDALVDADPSGAAATLTDYSLLLPKTLLYDWNVTATDADGTVMASLLVNATSVPQGDSASALAAAVRVRNGRTIFLTAQLTCHAR
jgi:hypothetical protein